MRKTEIEKAEIELLLKETEAVRSEIRDVMASMDWEGLPATIAARAAAPSGRRKPALSAVRPWGWLPALGMRPALAGLVVGAAAMYLALGAPGRRAGGAGGYYASAEFLDRAELEMARRNTLDYLEKSQYVLLDVFESAEGGPAGPSAVRADRARDLLQRKKYLNAQLERFQMAKAKAICDQIEALFLELAQIGDDLPPAELRRRQGFVEERQILLKINLVKKELQSGV